MIRYLIATYILVVLLVSGMAKMDLGKTYFQFGKSYLDNALDYDLLKIKSASNKMLVAQNKESGVVLPPNLDNFRFEI